MCKPWQQVTVMETGARAVKGKVFLTAASGDVPHGLRDLFPAAAAGSWLDESQSFYPRNGGGQELGFKAPEKLGLAQPLL